MDASSCLPKLALSTVDFEAKTHRPIVVFSSSSLFDAGYKGLEN
jgi:hypothetical protein